MIVLYIVAGIILLGASGVVVYTVFKAGGLLYGVLALVVAGGILSFFGYNKFRAFRSDMKSFKEDKDEYIRRDNNKKQ